jgi:hypothetical protein
MIEQVREIVKEVLAEAKKKKKKEEELEEKVEPCGYSYSATFDFSAPLAAYNLYKSQGAVNWGPMTGPGPKLDDRVRARSAGQANLEEHLRSLIGRVIEEEVSNDSAWNMLSESFEFSKPQAPPKKGDNIWKEALHWFDHQRKGLGGMGEGKKKGSK